MTYTPGLNGGRINATIAGNTAGVGALVSTGSMTLAGGNNITLSQAGNAITISGGAGGGAGSNTLGMSNLGNTVGTSGVISGSALQYALAGGNNVTLSQSLNGSSGTLTISAANQSVQTQNLYNLSLSGNTAGAMAQVSSGTLTLAGGNNITLSQNGNAITVSGGAGGGTNTMGMSNLGNTAGTSGTITGSALQFAFAGGNNITLSQSLNGSSGTITVSAANQSVQTQNLVGDVVISGNTLGATADISSGTMTLAGGSNVSLSQNGNAISINAIQSVGLPNQGNTAGNTGYGRLGFAIMGGNNITLSGSSFISYQSVTISGPNMFNEGISNLGNTVGTSGTASNQVVWAGGNNVTLSQSTGAGGNTITISAPNFATAAAPWTEQLAGNTAGTMSTLSSGTIQWAGGNNVTLSQSQQSITIHGGPKMLSRWEYPEGNFTSIGAYAQGSLSINHQYIPFNVTGTAMKIGGSLSAATNTSATTASANVSLWMGIYTLTGSTLSLASSGSANNGFVWSQTASTTGNTSVNSMRQMTVPINVNMTPGEYWIAAVISTATTYTSFAYSLFGNSLINNAATGAVLSPIGSNTTANRDVMLFQGIYTAATAAGPNSMAGADINNTSASNVVRANFYNVIYNATY